MKRIVVFGLTGDPPHKAHEQIATMMVERDYADEVWFMPCGQHPFDKNEEGMSSRTDRFAMTRIVVDRLNREHGNRFVCSPMEIRKKAKSYTIETLDQVKRENPEAEVGFVMGSDQLPKFKDWKDYEKILNQYKVYVYPRPDYPMEPWYKQMIKIEGVSMLEYSSTAVREREGRPSEIPDVADDVQEYIDKKGKYAKQNQ